MNKPIVWTIAGSDSGGGAGVQADLHTFQALGTFGCSAITTITAQNSQNVTHIEWVSTESLMAQLAALNADLPPQAMKLGMLGSKDHITIIADFLKGYKGPVICDPVMIASSGGRLFDPRLLDYFIQTILPHVTLLTPNRQEAERLCGRTIQTDADYEVAAQQLLNFGPKSILIKGGHQTEVTTEITQASHSSGASAHSQDYWTNGQQAFWLTAPRYPHPHTHGSGCTLSAAITAALAQGYDLTDALVIAKMYINQAIRHAGAVGAGPGPVAHLSWPEEPIDLPWLTHTAAQGRQLPQFADCLSGFDGQTRPLGLYTIVDSPLWLEKLLAWGVTTLQLRVKNKPEAGVRADIQASIALMQAYPSARLFINDYWQLAIEYGAYGVHLGQEDLDTADIHAIQQAGLRLGVSTHCYYEVARAHALRPSYIACGPIYHSDSKMMPFAPQGLPALRRWRRILADYPLVAIGGINLARLPEIVACGVDGIAVISAITKAADPEAVTREFLNYLALEITEQHSPLSS